MATHRDGASSGKDDAKLFQQVMTFMMSKEEDTEQLQALQAKLKKNRSIGRMTNKSGYTPLHVGIQMEAPWRKIAMLLFDREVARQRNPAGRLPLHMALDYYPKEEILNSLIDLHPTAVKEYDVDTRLPLHIVLEQHPFSVHFADIAARMIEIHPQAAQVRYTDGRLPLHMALDRCLPAKLVLKIFKSYRTAASRPKRDGKYPLHLALEMEFEAIILAQIMEAHPKALMVKMPIAGRRVLPLEFAIKKRYPLKVIATLMDGGGSNSARVLAYARAVAVGRIGKDMRAEGSSRGGKVLESTKMMSMFRDSNGMLRTMETSASNLDDDEDGSKVKCLIKSDEGLILSVLCDPTDKVEDLKLAVQEAESKALQLQEKEGTAPDEQRLMLGTTQLMDGRTLEAYGIVKECMIHFQQRNEVFHEALRVGLADDIVSQFLWLRPENAREDDTNGAVPLHIALMHKASPPIVMQLIEVYPQAAQDMVKTALGKYPLHIALEEGYPSSTIESLLKAKSHAASEADWTPDGFYNPAGVALDIENSMLPLHMAIQFSRESQVKANIRLLLESKCPICARHKATGYSAVECVLANKCNEELFRVVLQATTVEAPESLAQESPMGQMPIHVACAHGASVGVVETLVDMNPLALGHYDKDGRLPIHLAMVNHNSFPTIRYLLQQRPHSVNECDAHHHTPLQLAVEHKAAPGIVKQIVRMDPRAIHVRDAKGRSLVETAVAANAPNWILHELYEADPEQVQKISILQGAWPSTKAATEVMRMISNRHEEHNQRWQHMFKASATPTYPRSPPRPSTPSRASMSEREDDQNLESPPALEFQHVAQDDAMCDYSCSIT